MKRYFFIILLTLSLMIFSAASAQQEAEAEIVILDVYPGESISLVCNHFEPETSYTANFADAADPDLAKNTAKFNSNASGVFIVNLNIPEFLQDAQLIRLTISSENGSSASKQFVNRVPEAPAADAPDCEEADFSFDVLSVVKGKTVTVRTKDFPLSTEFSVRMGVFGDIGTLREPTTEKGPGKTEVFFRGTEVDIYQSEDGSPAELTFAIPEGLKDHSAFLLWFGENDECRRYTYSLIWNTDAAE